MLPPASDSVLESIAAHIVPLYDVLWADLNDTDLTIHYALPVSKAVVRATSSRFPLDGHDQAVIAAWIERLLDFAYGTSQRRKRIKVLINPFGGKGHAQKYFTHDIEPILKAARCEIDVETTQHQGHAVEIARDIDISAYDVIASCSGDGLPHEVFNGLGKKEDAAKALRDIAVVQLPCGSGNAMSWNLNGTDSRSLAALAIVKGLRTPLDLVSITQGDRRTLSFLSQSVGIVAESDLGTEHLRWMGDVRFTYGFFVRLLGKTVYPCDIAVMVVEEDKEKIKQNYRKQLDVQPTSNPAALPAVDSKDQGLPPLQFGTVNDPLPSKWHMSPYPTIGNFYAGNMSYMAADANFFQAALPSDGCLDLVCIDGKISRWLAVQTLMAVESGKFFDMSHVSYRKVAGYRIVPKKAEEGGREKGYISIDGERIPFEPFQVEVHKGLGTVLSRRGAAYEVPELK